MNPNISGKKIKLREKITKDVNIPKTNFSLFKYFSFNVFLYKKFNITAVIKRGKAMNKRIKFPSNKIAKKIKINIFNIIFFVGTNSLSFIFKLPIIFLKNLPTIENNL
ncbi:MAG: hypothetical protein Q8Q48_02205 [Candidatus Staskawiczbacteria bacterium]|nr:hypothetical protein [Candidatus Staskawiczbacteria bacterium]